MLYIDIQNDPPEVKQILIITLVREQPLKRKDGWGGDHDLFLRITKK